MFCDILLGNHTMVLAEQFIVLCLSDASGMTHESNQKHHSQR